MSKNITKAIATLGIIAGLGVAALPLSSYATDSDITVTFKVDPTIGTADTSDCVTVENTGVDAGASVDVDCDLNFSSNSPSNISIVDKDADTNLVGTTVTNTIPAFTTAQTTLVPTTVGWGYKFNVTAAGAATGLVATPAAATYQGVLAAGSPTVVASSSEAVNSAAGKFSFGISTDGATAADTYTDVVTVAITAQ